MVQRYYIHPMAFGAVKNTGYGHIEVVKYEDYAALQGLMFRLTDQFNLCELPDDLYEALEAAGIL